MLSVDEAILTRRSVRAFKSDPVPRATIEHILEVACRAPSGTNMQPWRVHVFTGAALESLCDTVLDAFWNEPEKHEADRLHYLEKNRDPYLARRRKVVWRTNDNVPGDYHSERKAQRTGRHGMRRPGINGQHDSQKEGLKDPQTERR